ncbi:hypothetical protein POM88_000233 [Heracleum sosnowskyi]|uniref:Uncharacterized protein n=1 Tax=Heracleum sosnowskyi TaxID=360622 RepID=A0AAD8JB29_9APIA|nr:hypothetical protein POM88_000233 [Heracleum sosnowskyi]
MATFKLLALTFTILYFFAFSTARISIPLNVQPKHVINRDNDVIASDRVSRPSFKRTVFLPIPDHESSDKVLGVELNPEVFEHDKHDKQKSSGPNNVELTKFNNNDLNDDHKAADAITIELEMERPNHMTQSKNKEPGVSDQDILIKEPRESDQDFPIKDSHESDHDLPVEHHESDKNLPVLSENTISIETLNLNPSNYFRIRPINRHFRIKPSIFRIHRCRHHHMNQAHQNNRQIPYGNDMILTRDDMILAGQTKERFDPSTLHISSHSDPEKMSMTHHHHHHDEDKNIMMRRPFRQYIARQKLKKKVEEEIQKRKEMDARKQGGFMKSFRKFLTQF